MALSLEQRSLLLRGPGANKARLMRAFDGPAGLLVTWKRYRAELLAECSPGHRCWAYWLLERRLKQLPSGEAGELRAIKAAGCYRDESERAYVEKRLAEIINLQRMSRHPHRAVA